MAKRAGILLSGMLFVGTCAALSVLRLSSGGGSDVGLFLYWLFAPFTLLAGTAEPLWVTACALGAISGVALHPAFPKPWDACVLSVGVALWAFCLLLAIAAYV